jgi:hypothetical protein
MSFGADRWVAADRFAQYGGPHSVKSMRFYALTSMLADAETSCIEGKDMEAIEHLRELQAHCEKMIALLAPEEKHRPTIVAA